VKYRHFNRRVPKARGIPVDEERADGIRRQVVDFDWADLRKYDDAAFVDGELAREVGLTPHSETYLVPRAHDCLTASRRLRGMLLSLGGRDGDDRDYERKSDIQRMHNQGAGLAQCPSEREGTVRRGCGTDVLLVT
jgi:hypothetical protein